VARPTVHYADRFTPHRSVLEGEMIVGARRLTAGCSVFIPGHTLYSFKAGPDGLRFLNFRPHKVSGLITEEELAAVRKARS
jgi:hypothetical protein